MFSKLKIKEIKCNMFIYSIRFNGLIQEIVDQTYSSSFPRTNYYLTIFNWILTI